MLHPASRRRCFAPAWLWVLCLALGLVRTPAAPGQEGLLRRSLESEGDLRRPVQFLADDISTWKEDGIRVFVLQGRVVVGQSPWTARMDNAVVWIDEEGQKKTGVFRMKVAGNQVELEEGTKKENAGQAVLDLATRREIAIKAYVSKVSEKNLSTTERYQAAFRLAKEPGKPLIAPPPRAGPPKLLPGMGLPAPAKEGSGKIEPGRLPAPLAPAPREETVARSPGESGLTLVQAIEPVPTLPGTLIPPRPPPSLPPPPLPGSPATTPTPPLPPGPPKEGPLRQLIIRPGSARPLEAQSFPQPNGETAIVVTSRVIIAVNSITEKKVLLDIEADRLVVWTKGDTAELFSSLKSPSGKTSNSLEFYLSGDVIIRNQTAKETQVLRAKEVYYDVGRGVAVALQGDLEIQKPGLKNPIHLQAEEIIQLNPKLFTGKRARAFSTELPSDPGLTVELADIQLEEREVPKRSIFGKPFVDPATGKPRTETQQIFTGRNMLLRLEGFPIFYFPYLHGDVSDPLGPLETINLNFSPVFGTQLLTTFNVFDLLGVDEPPNTRWRLMVDYLSARGPALGTTFDTSGADLFGIHNQYFLSNKGYTIYDKKKDTLGGDRGNNIFIDPVTSVPVDHPKLRGRWLSRLNVIDLPNGFSVQGQFAAISDQNFLEQYYPGEWSNELNQETYLYVKQQNGIWAWSVLGEPRLRQWITETEWLPRADAWMLGQKFFDVLTYNTHASAGYARLRPTEQPSFAYLPTDQPVNTGRFDWTNELSLPFQAGPIKFAPYLVGDLTYYTQDLTGNEQGRIYAGGGVRASMPLSRLYPDICSELLNLDGIYHKMLFYSNFYTAESNVSYQRLPQLDRLNDDASDQALRDFRPFLPKIYPQTPQLVTSAIFDPQVFAIRRLIEDRIDTRDDIQVLQVGLGQRLQTRRGLPGNQHVIDWMTLDVRASIFPRQERDNFGHLLGILEYDWVWNIGDRTALTSSGWFEPFDNGPRVFNFGTHLGRPDNTTLYLGYRQIDPLQSRAFIGSATYPFSAKYAFTGSSVYDFGVKQLSHSLNLTRMGTDLMASVGVNYNSTLKTFGVTFEVLPVLLPSRFRPGAIGLSSLAGGR